MKTIVTILGFLIYCTAGNGRGLPFWRALAKYTHRYIYTANQPFTYKRVKDTWFMEGLR